MSFNIILTPRNSEQVKETFDKTTQSTKRVRLQKLGTKITFKTTNALSLQIPCSVYKSTETNCIILTNGPKTPEAYMTIRNKDNPLIVIELSNTIAPPVSFNTEVFDLEYHDSLLIIRWPLWLHAHRVRPTSDGHRTIGRQLSESQSIQESFPPLGKRSQPYPFFIPSVTLDPVWSPAISPPLPKALREQFLRDARAKIAGQ